MSDTQAFPLEDRLLFACVAACTCDTKTPEVNFHRSDCRYRVLMEAHQVITALKARNENGTNNLREAALVEALQEVRRGLRGNGNPIPAVLVAIIDAALAGERPVARKEFTDGCWLAQSLDKGNEFLHGPFETAEEAQIVASNWFEKFSIRRVWPMARARKSITSLVAGDGKA